MLDDFYCESSEFDTQIEEFKETLRASVKEEILQELESLRKENELNRELRNNWHQKVYELEKDYNEKKRELSLKIYEAENAVKNAKHLRLKELLVDYPAFAYAIHIEYVNPPKCNQCDQYRRIAYKTPLGRTAYEDCICAQHKPRYHVRKVALVEINQNYPGSITPRYLIHPDRDEDYLRYANKFYDETPFDEIKYCSDALFKSETKARLFASYKNKKEGWQAK